MSAELNKTKKSLAWEVIRKTGGYAVGGVADYFSDAMPNMRSLSNEVGAEINGIQKKMQLRSTQSVRQGSRLMKMKTGLRGILRWYLQEGDEYDGVVNEAENLSYDTGEGPVDTSTMEISEQEKSANQISAAVTKGLHKSLEGQIELASELNHTMTEINTAVTTGIDRITSKLDEFIKVYTKNSSTQIEATVGTARQQENTDPMVKMFREGSFNFKDYKKILSSNITQTVSDYGGPMAVMLQQMLPMMLDLDLLKQLTPDKLVGLVAEPLIEKVLPGFKQELTNLDKDISKGLLDILLKAGDLNRGNDRNFLTLLGKIFGIKPTRQDQGTASTRAELSDMGPVPFDRLAHETLVNTIPGYLREMIHLLGGKDMVYDYKKRTFRSQEEIDQEFRDMAAPTNMLSQGGMAQYKGLFYNDKFTNVAYDQLINDLRSRVDDGSYADIIQGFGDKDRTRQYLKETLFRNVDLNEAQNKRLDDMTDSLFDLKEKNGLTALSDQVTRGNMERNEQMRAYINDAKTYNKDLRHLRDSYVDDRAWIFDRVGLKEKPKEEESTVTGPKTENASDAVYGIDYTNIALYEIYRRLNEGINVFQVGSSKRRRKPFEKLEDSYLGPPKTYRPKKIHDEGVGDEDITEGTRTDTTVVDENGNPVKPVNPLLKNGEDDERTTIQRVGEWAKGRGGQLWQAMRHGDAGEFRQIVGDSIGDVSQAVGVALQDRIKKADKQFGNISGWLNHKLTGKEYEYQTGEVDENGNPVIKYIAKNEKGGLFGVAGDYLKEMFEAPLKGGKKWIKDVLGYFDYSNDGTTTKDGDVENKRRRIMAAAVGAFAGAGILGGPVGMIAGAIAGNAVLGSGIGKKIKELFFGRDEESGKAKGILTKMGDAVVMPITYQFSKTAHTLGNALKRNVFGPLSDLGQAIKDRLMSKADTVFGKAMKGIFNVLTFVPRKILKATGWLAGKAAGGMAGLIPGAAGGMTRGAIRVGTGLFGGAVTSLANSISKHSGQRHVITDENGEQIELSSYEYQKYLRKQREDDTEKFDKYKDWKKSRQQRIAKLRKDAKDSMTEREMTKEEREAYLAQKEAAEIAKRTEATSKNIEENTEKAADAAAHIDDQGSNRGSIFTHDQGQHNRLDQIIQILTGMSGTEAPEIDDHSEVVPPVKPVDQAAAEIGGQTSLFLNEDHQMSLFNEDDTEDIAAAQINRQEHDNEVANAAVGAAAQISSSSDGISQQEAAASKKIYQEAAKPNSSAKEATEGLIKLQDMNEETKAEIAEKKEKNDSNIIDKIFSTIGGGITDLLTKGWPLIAGALFALSSDFRQAITDLASNLLNNLPSVISGAWKMVKGAAEYLGDVTDAHASGGTVQTNTVTGNREVVVSAEQHAADVEQGISSAAWDAALDPTVLALQGVEGAVAKKVVGLGIRTVGRAAGGAGLINAGVNAVKVGQQVLNSGLGWKNATHWAGNAFKGTLKGGASKAGAEITRVGQAYKAPWKAPKGARALSVGGALLGEGMSIMSNFGWETQERSRHGNVIGNYGIQDVNAAGYVRTSSVAKNVTSVGMQLAGPLAAKGAMALAGLVGATGLAAAAVVAGVVVVVLGLAYGLGRLINSIMADHTNKKNIEYSIRSNATKMSLVMTSGVQYMSDGNDPLYVYCGQPADRCVGLTDGETIADPEVVIGKLLYGIFFGEESLPGAEILLHDVIKNMAVQGVPFAVGLVGDSKAVKANGEQRNSSWGTAPLTGTGSNTQVLKSTVTGNLNTIMSDIQTNIARYGSEYIWDYEKDLKLIWDQAEKTINALIGANILDASGKVLAAKFTGDPGTTNGAGWDALEKLTRQNNSYFLLQSLIYINSKVDANKEGKQWIQTHQSQIEKLFEKLADFLKLEKDKAKAELMAQGYTEAEAEAEINGKKDPTTVLAKSGAETVQDTYQSYKGVEKSGIRSADRADFAKELKYLSAAYAYAHPDLTIPWAQKNMEVSGLNPNYKTGNPFLGWKNEKDSKKRNEMLQELANVSMRYAETHGDIFGLTDLFDFKEGGKVYPKPGNVMGVDSSKMYGTEFLIRGYKWDGEGTLDKLFEDPNESMYKKKNPEEMHKILFGKKEHGAASEAGDTKNQDWTLGGSGLLAEIASRIDQYGNTKGSALAKGDNRDGWRNILVNLPARSPKNLNVTDTAEGVVKKSDTKSQDDDNAYGGPISPISNFNNADAEIDYHALGSASAMDTSGGYGAEYANGYDDYSGAEIDEGDMTYEQGGNPLNKDYRITSGYGWRDLNKDGANDDYHTGIDIAPADGSQEAEVGARYSGTISKVERGVSDSHTGLAQTTQTEGNQVWIDTYDGKRIKLMHLKEGSIPDYLKEGSSVEPGDYLGEMGSTGRSSGPHLHYQVENTIGDDTSAINPKSSLNLGKSFDSFAHEDRGTGGYNTYSDYMGTLGNMSGSSGSTGPKEITTMAEFIQAISSAGSRILAAVTGGLLGSETDPSTGETIDGTALSNISLYDGQITASGSAADFLKFCAQEIGTTENPPNSNRTKYGEWYGLNGEPWCMIFVQWCFSNYGIPLSYKTASCNAMIDHYKASDSARVLDGATSTPQPGDLVFFRWEAGGPTKHVGIVEAQQDKDTFITIEGNTSAGESGSQDNGGGVYRRTRKRKNISYFIHAHDFATDNPAASIGDVANNEEGIWKYLKKRGLSDQAAAGVMGNFYAESSFKSNNLQGDYENSLGFSDESYTKAVDSGSYSRDKFMHDSAGYGLAQWTYYTRKAGLYDYAKSRGASIGDHNMQLDHFWQTIHEGQKPHVITQLDNASTVEEASDIMMNSYEDPADKAHQGPKRRAYSKQYYDRWHGVGGPLTKGNAQLGGPKRDKDSPVGGPNIKDPDFPIGGPNEDLDITDAELNVPDADLDLEAVGGPSPQPDMDIPSGTSTTKNTPSSTLDLPWIDPLNTSGNSLPAPETFADGAGPVAMYGDLPLSSIQKPDKIDIQDAYLRRANQINQKNDYYQKKQEEIMQYDRENPLGGPAPEMKAPTPPTTRFSLKDDLERLTPQAPVTVNNNTVTQIDLSSVLDALNVVTSYLSQIAVNTGASTDQLGLLAENGFVDKDVREQFESLGKRLKSQSGKTNSNTYTRANSRVVSNLVRP